MSAFCLLLPHTPPESKGRPVTAREILGLDALVLLKDDRFWSLSLPLFWLAFR